jgi:hypothetical protein
MQNTRSGLLGVLILVAVSETTLVLPTGAAELRPARFYEAVPKRSFSYPYGGSYLFGTYYARRLLGSPYVGSYYGSYYGPYYTNLYDPYYINYYDPFLYPSSGCAGRIRPCR